MGSTTFLFLLLWGQQCLDKKAQTNQAAYCGLFVYLFIFAFIFLKLIMLSITQTNQATYCVFFSFFIFLLFF